MGLCIALTNEASENLEFVSDDKNFLHKLLPGPEDNSSPMLGAIDWYGDTVFNSIQMKRFIAEWDRLEKRATAPDEKALVQAVRNMAQRCEGEIHLYLKFVGD
jgi:hypothetical protein